MSDIFGISSTAVAAYQRALGTVSNNIANVGTDGYVRQETKLTENPSRQTGNVYLGTGVRFVGVQRAYDQFLESNLRNTTSDLNTQEPMVNYANRIIDIMGSDTTGLSPALDKFFAAAQALSTDPASPIMRGQFLRDADGLAAQFRQLSEQLEMVDTETREAVNGKVDNINNLSGQLALVNKQLSREAILDRQPPELLDQRDRLLTELSKLVKINVTTTLNGSVNVSIGNTPSTGVIVNGLGAIPLAARFDESDLGRVSIVVDAYSRNPEAIAGVKNGLLGGLLSFREQVLQPALSQLDFLATTLTNEVNAIHTGGIDARGEQGKALFEIKPVTRTDPVSGENLSLNRAAAGMRMVIADSSKVAAGALFRVIENENNLSGVNASLSYAASYADPARVPSLSQVLKNNASASAGIVPPATMLLGQIPLGASNWSLFLDGATDQQQLQVFTRDGRQLLGAPLVQETDRRGILTEENGFIAGSTYSAAYLNQSGIAGYKQIDTFYGLKAIPGTQFDADARFTAEHGVLPTTREYDQTTGINIAQGETMVAGGTLSLNGKVLPALYPTSPSRTLQASDFANWFNRAADGMIPTVSVNALTQVTMPEDFDPTAGRYLNGIAIPQDEGRDLSGLAAFINDDIGNLANVEATIVDGKLVLSNAPGYGGNDIRVGVMNEGGDLSAEDIYEGTLNFGDSGNITIGYGPNGKLGDLEVLGTPSGKYALALMPRALTDAVISGGAMPTNVTAINAGALTLNGIALPDLDLNRALKASDIVTWLNTAGSTMNPAVVAAGATEIRATAAQLLQNRGTSLKINDQSITLPVTYVSDADYGSALVTAINAASTTHSLGVTARLDSTGGLVLRNDTGEDITLAAATSGARNALGVGNGNFKGAISLSSSGEIRLGFGEGGNPAELAKLGLRTGVYIEGAAQEDLLVFVTGEGSGTIAGRFDSTMADLAALDAARITSLREQEFDVRFTSATRYEITWKNPANGFETVLAEREYDSKAGIEYRGLKLTLDSPPAVGDRFIIDGNADGVGNNENVRRLVALEQRAVVGGSNGQTIAQAYEEGVGKIGNFSSQATIAQKALEVVNQQAIEARDRVSGVSLDSEAADLIRYQQAYQASAKAMQTAGTLFDAILQVR